MGLKKYVIEEKELLKILKKEIDYIIVPADSALGLKSKIRLSTSNEEYQGVRNVTKVIMLSIDKKKLILTPKPKKLGATYGFVGDDE